MAPEQLLLVTPKLSNDTTGVTALEEKGKNGYLKAICLLGGTCSMPL